MRSFSLPDVPAALADLDICPGGTVLMHASMIALGSLEGHSAADAPKAIVASLLDHLGPNGVLVTPAFNFDFCRGAEFDRDRTPCSSMGVLAETIRTWPASRRSRHPMQSVAAIGAQAQRFCEDSGEHAFASDSAFGRLVDDNARVLLFGTNFQAASLIHCAEERVGVSYRYWKEFQGDYIDRGVRRRHTCWMYVRDLTLDPQLNMKPVEVELATRGLLRTCRLGRGSLSACSAQDLLAAAEAVLYRDRLALVGSANWSTRM